jgi:hypothetical protein
VVIESKYIDRGTKVVIKFSCDHCLSLFDITVNLNGNKYGSDFRRSDSPWSNFRDGRDLCDGCTTVAREMYNVDCGAGRVGLSANRGDLT